MLGSIAETRFGQAVLLATSELVDNALAHTGGVVRVRVWGPSSLPTTGGVANAVGPRFGAPVLIEVEDEDPRLPAFPPMPSPSQLSGRGLHIVDTLSHAWGMHASRHGKVVWCELVADADGDAARRAPMVTPPA